MEEGGNEGGREGKMEGEKGYFYQTKFNHRKPPKKAYLAVNGFRERESHCHCFKTEFSELKRIWTKNKIFHPSQMQDRECGRARETTDFQSFCKTVLLR